ncbi:glycoside hydrolase family 2 TIM barrel-domain containing protein [Sphingobium boeckii]|uniref:Beta-galactosidase n=1 Tax=Sphingobium boeckii TaxID=1082345 RepID=A0A7W9ALR2_9SPHN|nr:glycoside hydrolase family 2 TIM barrel-domain containing protein [Sphingobium boeckii]MBB5687826.1 beta-galactosidase [Sphingobium boeckii]
MSKVEEPTSAFDLARRDTLRLAAGLVALWSVPAGAQTGHPSASPNAVRDRPFDDGWRFHRGDGQGFETASFADQSWREVDLPHDWSIEDLPSSSSTGDGALWRGASIPERVGPFDRAASDGGLATGFTVGGTGWYRKRFALPEMAVDGRVEVLFDGIYMDSDVWINGHHLGNHPDGYNAFSFDLTPHLNAGGENVLAVRVRNIGHNSRWYSGSGIYRQVKLAVTGPVRFPRWGIGITTPKVAARAAQVDIATRVEGLRPDVILGLRIMDSAGRVVAERRVEAASEGLVSLVIANPRLWSPDTPALYRLEVELRSGEMVFDRVMTDFGIRNVEIDARRGLRINGRPYKLRGACVHHDNGLLGAAAFPDAEERRVKLLKARGFNAIRTAHNPPSAAFLDACDREGMLVMDEAFDVWNVAKTPDDYHKHFKDNWQRDLGAMVLRDRNHPSVIMWSIGNEIKEKLTPEGNRTAWMLAREVNRLDPTRPITAAVDGFSGRPVAGLDGEPDQPAFMYLDIAGYNYRWPEFVPDHARYPGRVMIGTESRPGEMYPVWTLIDDLPYVIGDFVWTGMDHLGEAGWGSPSLVKPGQSGVTNRPDWPWIVNAAGDIDLIGEQRPQSLARDVIWGLSPVEITVQRPVPKGMQEYVGWAAYSDELPSWTWPGKEGELMAVRVYTMGDRVQLLLDGKPVGTKALGPHDMGKAEISVPYAPGELVAVSSRGGKEIGRKALMTRGAPAGLRIRPDRTSIASGRSGLAFLTIEIVDSAGHVIPDAFLPLEIAADGPVTLAAFGSANPRWPASFQSPRSHSFQGRALAILRGLGTVGQARVTVSGRGLSSTSVVIQVR